MGFTPSDTLFGQQWYLRNTGQSGGTAGMDIRIDGAWLDYTGVGVRVAVIDDGVFYQHPDLAPTYDLESDGNFDTGEPDGVAVAGVYSHGTQVSSFLGSALNGIGIVGVSYGATFTSLRATSDTGAYVGSEAAMSSATSFDVTNNSYGNELFGQSAEAFAAVERTATIGREGLGTVNVFAAGNERYQVVLSTHGGEQNSPYQINVAATDADGRIAAFSTPGANVFVSAPGAGVLGVDGLDTLGYALTKGTSFATPIVSGVAALVIQANPALGYRDVFEILGYSAYDTGGAPLTTEDIYRDIFGSTTIPDTVSAGGVAAVTDAAVRVTSYPWTTVTNGAVDWNGGGLTVSHDFGLGQVDARAATRLAETWSAGARTTANLTIVEAETRVPQTIPDGDAAGISQTVSIGTDIRVESAVVQVTLPHGEIGDLRIELISPQGTVSYLIYNPDYDIYSAIAPGRAPDQETLDNGTFLVGGDSAVLMTTQVYGESSLGDWTLRVADTEAGTSGTLQEWSLSLFGGAQTADDRYVYTDQYADLSASDAARSALADVDGGTDTINASAVSGSVRIALTPGAIGSIGGAAFRVAEGTAIENLFTGDGDDTLIGNSGRNHLAGGRGSDMLSGGAGDDRLDGGRGLDRAMFDGSRAGYTLAANADGSVSVVSAGGSDTLVNIEILGFDDGFTAARVPTGITSTGFDAELYLAQYPDLQANGISEGSAYSHYLAHGALEGRAPNALFDSTWYLARNRDVAAAGVNPLEHYYRFGHLEDRDPSVFFDASGYLAANPDVAAAGINPLDHFLRFGVAEGRLAYGVSDFVLV